MPYRRSYSRGRGNRSRFGGSRRFSTRGMPRRSTARRSRRAAPRRSQRTQTIRIVVEQPNTASMAADLLGRKVAPGPKKARF